MITTGSIVLMCASYVLGGIPSGYLIARSVKGIDIRQHGSGNPGAANVYRIVGKWAGWATFLMDSLKGFIPVMLAKHYYPDNIWIPVICGSLAIFGHMWTIFLKFKGGKGVATSAGVFGALLPFPVLLGAVAFVISVALSGHISVGSITAAAVVPVASFAMKEYPPAFSVLVAVVCAIIIYKHIPNIKRLLKNQELAFKDGSAPEDKK